MDLGEIIRKSWGLYKRNFPTLVIPFLILAVAISIVFGFTGGISITSYPENRTAVISGENLSSPNLLDSDDENYFEVKTVGADENYGLEVLHDSQTLPVVKISGYWIRIHLNFTSSIPLSYRFDIYDFSDNSWENGELAEIRTEEEVTWEISRITDVENYISDENFIRVRLMAENGEGICREDYLIYEAIKPPEFTGTLIGYIFFSLGLPFCCGIAIGVGHEEMLKRRTKLGDALKIAWRNYPKMLVTALMIVLPLAGVLYLLLNYPWGILMILPAILFLFFCVYSWQGVVIRSLSPWGSIKRSIGVAWRNLGVTFVLWLLLVLVWFLLGSVPIVGTIVVWLFLPFWVVALSVAYMDWTGELLENEHILKKRSQEFKMKFWKLAKKAKRKQTVKLTSSITQFFRPLH